MEEAGEGDGRVSGEKTDGDGEADEAIGAEL